LYVFLIFFLQSSLSQYDIDWVTNDQLPLGIQTLAKTWHAGLSLQERLG
jgi:hypothetical protein